MEIIAGILIIIYSARLPYSGDLLLSPAIMPFIAGLVLLCLGFVKGERKKIRLADLKLPLAILLVLILYIVLSEFLHFIITATIISILLLRLFGEMSKKSIIFSLMLSCSLFILFDVFLAVSL